MEVYQFVLLIGGGLIVATTCFGGAFWLEQKAREERLEAERLEAEAESDREERNARRRQRYHEKKLKKQKQDAVKKKEKETQQWLDRIESIKNNNRLDEDLKQKQLEWLRGRNV